MRKPRTKFSSYQVDVLSLRFDKSQYIDIDERAEIGSHLNLTQREVKLWFQNRRQNIKKSSSPDVKAEWNYLKRPRSSPPKSPVRKRARVVKKLKTPLTPNKSFSESPESIRNQVVMSARKHSEIQIDGLLMYFEKSQYIGVEEKQNLAYNLGLTPGEVKNWFQNRRNKLKKNNTPVSKGRNVTPRRRIASPVATSFHPLSPPQTPTSRSRNSSGTISPTSANQFRRLVCSPPDVIFPPSPARTISPPNISDSPSATYCDPAYVHPEYLQYIVPPYPEPCVAPYVFTGNTYAPGGDYILPGTPGVTNWHQQFEAPQPLHGYSQYPNWYPPQAQDQYILPTSPYQEGFYQPQLKTSPCPVDNPLDFQVQLAKSIASRPESCSHVSPSPVEIQFKEF